MKIKVSKSHEGSPDGVNVKTFEKDETYDMPVSLGSVFVSEKWGKEVKGNATPDEDTTTKDEDE